MIAVLHMTEEERRASNERTLGNHGAKIHPLPEHCALVCVLCVRVVHPIL